VSEAPATDTVREQHLNMLIEWVKKSPPEIIPYLMNAAMELSNLPNKEQLMARIRPILGIEGGDDHNLPPEEVKAQVASQLEAQQAEAARMKQVQEAEIKLRLENLQLTNEKLAADIESIRQGDKVRRDDQALKGVKAGFDIQREIAVMKAGQTSKSPAIGKGYLKAMAGGAP